MNQMLENMLKGLTLHFLHQRTVDEAIDQGRKAGVPEELLQSLPGMMFSITTAACAVLMGARTIEDVADEIAKIALDSGTAEEFARDDALKMLQITLSFIEKLNQDVGDDNPVPALTEPWFLYQASRPTIQQS